MISLEVKGREAYKNVAEARKAGLIPAVYYGSHTKSTAIYVNQTVFVKIFKEAGESTIVTLDTGKEKYSSLIHDVQRDPVNNKVSHVDFYTIEANQTLRVDVHLEFVGVSNAVKSLGATLVKTMHDVEVECLPQDLPHSIEVDISKLENIDDSIYLKDLILPKGVKIQGHDTDVVASVILAKEEDLSTPVAPVDLEAIEVEKKGKKEDEAGADAPAEEPKA